MKMHLSALGLMASFLVVACGGRKTAEDAERAAPASAEHPLRGHPAAPSQDDDDDDASKDHVEVAPDVQKRLGIGVSPSRQNRSRSRCA